MGFRFSGVALVCAVLLNLGLFVSAWDNTADGSRPFPLDSDYYDVVWDNVAESSTSREVDGNEDLGPCVCDLTLNRCDINCCCDSDCTATNDFTSCLTEGADNDSIKKCVNRDTLLTTNPPSNVDMTRNFLDDQICIEVENNPTKGFYFEEEDVDSSTWNDEFDDGSWNPSDLAASSTTASTIYLAGQAVTAAQLAGGVNLVSFNGGTVPLPAKDLSGYCSESHAMKYFENFDGEECIRQFTTMEQACNNVDNSTLSMNRYVENLRFGSTKGSAVTSESWITPSYYSVSKFTGALYDRNNLETLSGAFNPTSFNSTGCTCSNAVYEVLYTIRAGQGSLYAVEATLILADWILPVAADGTCNNNDLSFRQRFSVQWRSNNGNTTQVRHKSGNPGYKDGLPVIAGVETSASGKTAVQRRIGGLMSPGTGVDGSCSWADGSPIQFGTKSSGGCLLWLNFWEMRAMCTDTVTDWVAVNTTHVGKWGDADENNPGNWISLTIPTNPSASIWTEVNRECAGHVTGVHYEFLVQDFGSWANPQRAIVGARFRWTTDTWKFRSMNLDDRQPFQMIVTSSYVNIAPKTLAEFVPANPSPLPTLPEDFFYPFLRASSPATSQHSSLSYLCIVSIAVLLCLWHEL